MSNVTDQDQRGSEVKIGLRDERGLEVASLIAQLDVNALAPGQMAQFETRLENPPVDAFDLELSFLPADGSAEQTQSSEHVNAAAPEESP